ncbi:MAG: ammonium transporter [Ignavibacteriales bacterium]|nr:ammonium transporter [Ignavibacteriales bacterium]
MKKRKFWYVPFVLLCVASMAAFVQIPTSADNLDKLNSGDIAWMLTATGLVLLMTPGLSYFYGGMVSKKNVISTMLQSFIAMGVISVLWVIVGFSVAFGESIGGIIGNPMTYAFFRNVGAAPHALLSPTIPLLLFAMFQLKFAIITPALITGSFAERVRFSSYMLFVVLFSLFIYAPLAHMTWHPDGFLRKLGVLDFAGGTVVHMSAGFAALAGAVILGPRKSVLNKEKHQPANIPYVILGTGLLWFGWFGFNAGSALAANAIAVSAFATTNTASAAAALAWVFYDAMIGRKPSALGACVGAVVGLVAITPAAGYVSIGASIFIGTFASVLSNVAVSLKSRTSVDDTLDVFPCHGLGGLFGMLATGAFATRVGLIAGETATFLTHILASLLVMAFAFGGSWMLYKLTDLIIPMRVQEEQEIIGLDASQHGETTEGSNGFDHGPTNLAGKNVAMANTKNKSLIRSKPIC